MESGTFRAQPHKLKIINQQLQRNFFWLGEDKYNTWNMYSRRMSTEPLEKTSKFGADLISSLYKPSLTSSDHQIDAVRQQLLPWRHLWTVFRTQTFSTVMMTNLTSQRNDLRRMIQVTPNLKMKEAVCLRQFYCNYAMWCVNAYWLINFTTVTT